MKFKNWSNQSTGICIQKLKRSNFSRKVAISYVKKIGEVMPMQNTRSRIVNRYSLQDWTHWYNLIVHACTLDLTSVHVSHVSGRRQITNPLYHTCKLNILTAIIWIQHLQASNSINTSTCGPDYTVAETSKPSEQLQIKKWWTNQSVLKEKCLIHNKLQH